MTSSPTAPTPPRPSRADGPEPPPQVTMGLLDYLSSHTMDEDYRFVAQRRSLTSAAGKDAPVRRAVGPLGAVALVLFAVLLVIAGQHTSQNAASENDQRQELVGQVRQVRARYNAELTAEKRLRAETRDLSSRQGSGGALQRRLRSLSAQSGYLPVTGRGVKVVVDDARGATGERDRVLDTDLQQLTNGLWQAGAEAISINGQRLASLTAIRTAGEAITVNLRSLRAPYTVLAIGDPDTLPARFAETSSGQAWLDLQRQVGLRFQITTANRLRLAAAPTPTLRSAHPSSPPTVSSKQRSSR